MSEPVRLLVVADRPAQWAALEAMLGGSEAELVRATSPEEAAQLARTVGFAGVVLDLAGPAARGLEAAGLIRGVARARRTPIVVLVAAGAAEAALAEVSRLRAVDVLVAPPPALLRSRVEFLVELHREAADALRESEARLGLAVAIAGMGTFEIDLRSDAVVVNEPGRAIYGWEDTRTTFARVQTHFHPDDRDLVTQQVQAAFDPEGPGSFDVEHRIVRAGGEIRWLRVRGQAFFEGRGPARRVVRCHGTYIDVTHQERVEEALRDQLELVRAITDTATTAIFTIDAEGRCTFMNPAAEAAPTSRRPRP